MDELPVNYQQQVNLLKLCSQLEATYNAKNKSMNNHYTYLLRAISTPLPQNGG